jgi:hypothetical protein
MGRIGHPSELAGVVILLCSPAGKYINGADIVVDGESSVDCMLICLILNAECRWYRQAVEVCSDSRMYCLVTVER